MSHSTTSARQLLPAGSRRGVSGRLLIVLVLLVLLAAGGLGAAIMLQPGLRMRFTSTPVLIERILEARGTTAELWAELGSRELTTPQRSELLAGLLDKRRRIGFLPADDEAWFLEQREADQVPEPIVERYFQEMLDARVLRPSQAAAGSPTRLLVEFRDYTRPRPDRRLLVFVEGITLGDETERIGREPEPTDIKQLPRQRYRSELFTPAQPGPLVARFACWHVYGPPELADRTIEWSDDGAPVIPPEAIYARRIELEHEIDVR